MAAAVAAQQGGGAWQARARLGVRIGASLTAREVSAQRAQHAIEAAAPQARRACAPEAR